MNNKVMNNKGDFEATFYIVAILVFMLLLFGILASIFVSKNLDQGSSLADAYDEKVASLKTLNTISIIKIFLIIAIVGVIFYLWHRLKIKNPKLMRKTQKKK